MKLGPDVSDDFLNAICKENANIGFAVLRIG